MCGRMVRTHSATEIANELDAVSALEEQLNKDFNVAPTRDVPIVRVRQHDDAEPVRQVELARWGLVPSWAKDPSIGSRMINARVETVASKPSFRSAFAKKRCIVPASAFYEWKATDDGKQPYLIHAPDNSVLAFAGLYEFWRDAEGKPLQSCTVITTSAADDLGELHDRAPMIVPRDFFEQWLDPTVKIEGDFAEMLVPAVKGTFEMHPVDKAVGSVKNNYEELTLPITLD